MTTMIQSATTTFSDAQLAGRHAYAQGSKRKGDAAALDKALEITGVLQTTLELDRLVALFSEEMQSLVAHSGLRYHLDERGIDLTIGIPGLHSCAYRLMVGEQYQGELVFSRNERFDNQASQQIEYLLCSLVYPLRNALLYRQALQSAFTDPLTGVNNRAAFDQAIQREIDLANRHGTPLSLIVLDIDHFKRINDSFGHTVGDNALTALAKCAARTIRSTDILYRYGGEEFVILLSNTGPNGALLLAERLRREVDQMTCVCGDTRFNMTISAGVSTLAKDDTPTTLFARADGLLYQAKQEGRNRVRAVESAAA